MIYAHPKRLRCAFRCGRFVCAAERLQRKYRGPRITMETACGPANRGHSQAKPRSRGTEETISDAGEVAENHCAGGDCFAKARGAIDPERPSARKRSRRDRARNEGGRGHGPD